VRDRLVAESEAWRWPPRSRLVGAAKLHLTLHFIGGFARDRLDALATALAGLQTEPTALVATRREIWRGGIAVLLFAAGPELAALHEAIGGVVAAFGVPLDPRPFAPHVTLARAARGAAPPLRAADVAWDARGFALVASAPGGNYRVLRSFAGAGHDRSPGEPVR